MKIKEVTMGTSHGSPPPGTCYTDLSSKKKEGKKSLPTYNSSRR